MFANLYVDIRGTGRVNVILHYRFIKEKYLLTWQTLRLLKRFIKNDNKLIPAKISLHTLVSLMLYDELKL